MAPALPEFRRGRLFPFCRSGVYPTYSVAPPLSFVGYPAYSVALLLSFVGHPAHSVALLLSFVGHPAYSVALPRLARASIPARAFLTPPPPGFPDNDGPLRFGEDLDRPPTDKNVCPNGNRTTPRQPGQGSRGGAPARGAARDAIRVGQAGDVHEAGIIAPASGRACLTMGIHLTPQPPLPWGALPLIAPLPHIPTFRPRSAGVETPRAFSPHVWRRTIRTRDTVPRGTRRWC